MILMKIIPMKGSISMKIVQTHSSAKDIAYDGYLKINNCGLCADADQGISVDNRAGRRDYHFVYVVDGTMFFEIAGKRLELGAGKWGSFINIHG